MTIRDIKIDGSTAPLREFLLAWMVPNPAICMIAKKGSGKSWVVRSILKHFDDIPGGMIIAPTDKQTVFYGKFFPDVYIHYEYRSELLESLFFRQERIIDKCRAKIKEGKKVDPRAFLIMDDCLSSKGTWMRDVPISKMFFEGRHYKIMYILTMQFPLGIIPELRTNFDYIFLLAEDFYSNQKRLYDHYAGMFPDFKTFRDVFMDITKDHGCMVIVNRGSRSDFLDKVFWFKSKEEKFTSFGCKQFNQFHKNNYDEKWRERHKPFDINRLADEKKRNKSRIRVEKIHGDSVAVQ
jgi:hypothetical protein